MPEIIERLRSQTAPPKEIWLINNDGFDDFGADKLIAADFNLGERARYMVLRAVDTDYVAFQDDDFIMTDDDFLMDAIRISNDRAPLALTGVSGMRLSPIPPHYSVGAPNDDWCNMLKGHFQIMRKSALANVRIPWHPWRSDIQFSLDISRGQPIHWVSGNLKKRFKLMNQWGEGLEYRPEHWDEAEEVVAAYIQENGPWT